jgi:hypothetical protein
MKIWLAYFATKAITLITFFYCCVDSTTLVAQIPRYNNDGTDFESVAKFWPCGKVLFLLTMFVPHQSYGVEYLETVKCTLSSGRLLQDVRMVLRTATKDAKKMMPTVQTTRLGKFGASCETK